MIARAIVAGLMLLALQGGAPQQGQPADNGDYRLRIDGCADLTHLTISSYITGPFGGYGEFGTQRGVLDYAVGLTRNGQLAESLKVIILCPGSRMTLLDERPPFPKAPAMRTVRLEPLPLLPVSGRVAAKVLKPGLVVEAKSEVFGTHALFGMTDGMVPIITVASASVAADGTFTLHLPDFARDPLVQSYLSHGVFAVAVKDVATGNVVSGAGATLPVATQYPNPVILGGSGLPRFY